MSATNQTANYGLSQFIGTDVPGWLSDYNSDNAKIDTAIYAAKSAADAAATTAGQAANDITSINQTLTTQAAQISAAAQSASQAQTSAGQALNTAQQADGKADTNATAINDLDTRVEALESGGGGAQFTRVSRTLKNVQFQGSQGNAYTAIMNYADYLPAGKSASDIVSIMGFSLNENSVYVTTANSGFYIHSTVTAARDLRVEILVA